MGRNKNTYIGIALILLLTGISSLITEIDFNFNHDNNPSIQNLENDDSKQPSISDRVNPTDYVFPDPSDLSHLTPSKLSRLILYESDYFRDEAVAQLGEEKIQRVFSFIPAITTNEILRSDIPLNGLNKVIDNRKVVQVSTVIDQETPLEDKVTVGVSLATTAKAINIDKLQDIGLDGTGVKLAIIDTGVDGSLESFLGNSSSTRVTQLSVKALADQENDILNPHATHVAGIAGSNGRYFVDNSYSQFDSVGMAPNVEIISIRALDSTGFGEISWIVEGIEIAIDQGVDIISLSLSSELYVGVDDIQRIVVDKAIESGAIIVSAGGNLGPFGSGIGIPGALPNVITVGAISLVDDKFVSIEESVVKWPLTGIGPRINFENRIGYPGPDIVAPGDRILSIYPANPDLGIEGGSVHLLSGTSMATPHISGGIALLLQAFPDASINDIREALTGSAIDLYIPVEAQGRGLVDFKAAYDILLLKFNQDPDDDRYELSSSPRRIDDGNFVYRHKLSGETKTFPIYLHANENITIQPIVDQEFTSPQVVFNFGTEINVVEGLNVVDLSITLLSRSIENNWGRVYFVEKDSQQMLENANVTYYSRTSFTRAKILFDASKDNDTGGNYFAAHNAYGLFSKFTSFLEDEGHAVDSFKQGELNSTLLDNYDLLIIANPEIDYSPSELNAIQNFLNNQGKSMLLIGGGGVMTAETIDYATFSVPILNSLLTGTGLSIKSADGLTAPLLIDDCNGAHDVFSRLSGDLSCTDAQTQRDQDTLPELVSFPNFGPELAASSSSASTDVIARQDGKPVIVSSELNSNGRVLFFSSPLVFDNYGLTFGYNADPNDLRTIARDSLNWLIEPRSIKSKYVINNQESDEFATVNLHDDLSLQLSFIRPNGDIVDLNLDQLEVSVFSGVEEFLFVFTEISPSVYEFKFTFTQAGVYDLFILIEDPAGELISSNGHFNITATLKYFDDQSNLRSIGIYLFFALVVSWAVWLKNERRSLTTKTIEN